MFFDMYYEDDNCVREDIDPPYDSWDSFDEDMSRLEDKHQSREDAGAYLPDPDEVQERIAQMRWLQHKLKCPDRVINEIMIFDTPCIEMVRIMVNRVGATRAMHSLCRFHDVRIPGEVTKKKVTNNDD